MKEMFLEKKKKLLKIECFRRVKKDTSVHKNETCICYHGNRWNRYSVLTGSTYTDMRSYFKI